MMNRAPIYRYLRIGLVAFVWGLLIQPCFAGKVKALLQPDADFAHYKTYQWLPPQVLTKTGVVEDHPVFGPLVKDAVNRELARQGLKEVTEGGDLQVATTILTGAISQRPGYMLEGGSNAAATVYYTPVATLGGYNREGTLVVNLIDARTKKSAWIGMAQESLGKKVGSGQTKIAPAAEKIFKKYPSKK